MEGLWIFQFWWPVPSKFSLYHYNYLVSNTNVYRPFRHRTDVHLSSASLLAIKASAKFIKRSLAEGLSIYGMYLFLNIIDQVRDRLTTTQGSTQASAAVLTLERRRLDYFSTT